MGIEPTYPAWKAGVLPLNYTRISIGVTGFEPATSWSQTRRSSQTEPHPDIFSCFCVNSLTQVILYHLHSQMSTTFFNFLLFFSIFLFVDSIKQKSRFPGLFCTFKISSFFKHFHLITREINSINLSRNFHF